VIGLVILGITGAFITIPGIIDFMDTIKIEMNITENSANDIASGISINIFKNFYCFYIIYIIIITFSFI
jgi:hypothetical protein